MVTVRKVQALEGYRLRLTFSDGLIGDIEVDPRGRGPMFEPLIDPTYFRRVKVSRAAGTIVWPNGLDLDPETLHLRVVERQRPSPSRAALGQGER